MRYEPVSAWGVTLIPLPAFMAAHNRDDAGVLCYSATSLPETHTFSGSCVLRGDEFRRAHAELCAVSLDRMAPWPTVEAAIAPWRR